MTPGRAGYFSVKRSGRHGSLSDAKAVGSRWTKAVAMSTPVPKCLQKKKTFGGIFIHLIFFATTGKPAPKMEAMNTMTWNVLVMYHQIASYVLTNCSNVQRKVVSSSIRLTATLRFLHVGHCELQNG